jgi:hypothetical protein
VPSYCKNTIVNALSDEAPAVTTGQELTDFCLCDFLALFGYPLENEIFYFRGPSAQSCSRSGNSDLCRRQRPHI